MPVLFYVVLCAYVPVPGDAVTSAYASEVF